MSQADERSVYLDQLFERLPSWLELVDPAGLAPTLRDTRDGVAWRLFTAGEVDLGATPERQRELDAALGRHPLVTSPLSLHVPPRRLRVEPFLMREAVIMHGSEPRFLVSEHEEEAVELLAPFAARLPTEAEWEYAWHVVRAERGGWALGQFELCADGWSLERAELEHAAVVPGGPGVLRTASFDPHDIEWGLPARAPLRGVRLATVRPTLTCVK